MSFFSVPQTGVPRPPGLFPGKANYYLFGVIALLIISASLLSGHRKLKTDKPRPTPGTSDSQLQSFRQMLDRERQQVEQQKRQLEARLLAEQRQTDETQAPTIPAVAIPIDEIEAKRRAKAEAAPFASSIVSIANERKESDDVDRSSQVVVTEKAEKQLKAEDDRAAQESGKLLPLSEPNGLYRVFEGTTLQTTLVNRLDGSFSGPVICNVSEDFRTNDGTALLIPKNSRFIGKASRVDMQNQARLAVAFSRLLLPNGYSVNLESAPALDQEGRAGLTGRVDNHRLRTFGISGAIGLLGGLSLYRQNAYTAGVASATGSTATGQFGQLLNTVPTITIREGHSVVVYLPNDLLLRQYKP